MLEAQKEVESVCRLLKEFIEAFFPGKQKKESALFREVLNIILIVKPLNSILSFQESLNLDFLAVRHDGDGSVLIRSENL